MDKQKNDLIEDYSGLLKQVRTAYQKNPAQDFFALLKRFGINKHAFEICETRWTASVVEELQAEFEKDHPEAVQLITEAYLFRGADFQYWKDHKGGTLYLRIYVEPEGDLYCVAAQDASR